MKNAKNELELKLIDQMYHFDVRSKENFDLLDVILNFNLKKVTGKYIERLLSFLRN